MSLRMEAYIQLVVEACAKCEPQAMGWRYHVFNILRQMTGVFETTGPMGTRTPTDTPLPRLGTGPDGSLHSHPPVKLQVVVVVPR